MNFDPIQADDFPIAPNSDQSHTESALPSTDTLADLPITTGPNQVTPDNPSNYQAPDTDQTFSFTNKAEPEIQTKNVVQMSMNQKLSESTTEEISENPTTNVNHPKTPLRVVLPIVFITIIGFMGLATYLLNKPISQPKENFEQSTVNETPSPDIIAKVGNENIYQKDYDYQLSRYTEAIKAKYDLKPIIIEKLINDSVILQTGISLIDNSILDESVFNSNKKDYAKRQALIKEITDYLKNNAQGDRKGTVITIWFNNDWVGPLGLEQSKQIAFEKITNLRNRLINEEISIEEVALEIQNDPSLADLDKAYVSNAKFDFVAEKDKNITFDSNFDQIIWNLNEGELSEVITVINNEGKPVNYSFATVTNINDNGIVSFDKWLKNAKTSYEIYTY